MALVPRPEVNVYGCEPKLNKNKLNRHLKIEEKAAEKDAKKKELHEEQRSQVNAPACNHTTDKDVGAKEESLGSTNSARSAAKQSTNERSLGKTHTHTHTSSM